MLYLRFAIDLFGLLALASLVAGVLLLREGRYPRRLVNLFCASVCFVTMLLNLLVGQPWIALPWGLSVPIWLAAAMLHSRRST